MDHNLSQSTLSGPPMDLAFVSDSIYPYNKGGKEKRLFEITTRLASYGHRVTIYTMNWWQGESKRIEHGVTLQAICPKIELYTSGRRRSITQAISFGLRAMRPIWHSKHQLVEVDHIPYLQLFSVSIPAWVRRIPMMATWHEVWGQKLWQEYLGFIKGVAAGITEWLSARLPRRIISVSPLTSRRLNTILNVPDHKIITIPNGIDVMAIERIPVQTKIYDLIFVGRLLAHKNADLVIRVVKHLKQSFPNISCLLIGEGPEDHRLHELASSLKLESNITFRGSLPTEEIYRSYKTSRICLLPSSREGFGIVTLEANAAGLPVVTIDAPDNAMKDIIVEGENGFVCAAAIEPIAAVIQDLLRNDRRLSAMESSCRNAARQYNWDNIARQVEALYQSMIARI